MSMSMHIYAVKPADENYKRKAQTWKACETAGIPVPKELRDFFGGEAPDPTGTLIDLGNDYDGSDHESCMQLDDDNGWTFEIDITKLPEGARYVRVLVGG